MTNKNESAEVIRIRINHKKLDLLNPPTRPAFNEFGTRDDGTIVVVKRAVGRKEDGSVPAERGTE